MKLKLPLALLAALFACMNLSSAQDTTTDGSTGDAATETEPASREYSYKNLADIPVYTEPVVGSEENDYTVYVTGSNGACWDVNAKDVTWNQSHDYFSDAATRRVISVGSILTDSTVSIVKPEGAEEDTVVRTNANLFIGGWGWGIKGSDNLEPHSGRVYVGKGATLNVGFNSGGDSSRSQLNIGQAGNYAETGCEGIMDVDGGTVLTGVIDVGMSQYTKGTLNLTNGATVHVERRGDANNAKNYTGSLYVGYLAGSDGTVTLDGASTLTVDKDTWIGMAYDSELSVAATGTLTVKGKSTANLGSAVYVGYYNGSSGTVTVDDSTLVAGYTYFGLFGEGSSGTLTLQNGSTATLNEIVLGYSAGVSGAATVEASTLTVGGVYVGTEGGKGTFDVKGGGIANTTYVGVGDGDSVSVKGGSVLSSSGDMDVDAGGSMTVEQSNLSVTGTYGNYGTTTVTLAGGNTFEAGAVENSGTMTVTAEAGSSFTAGSVTVNQGATMNMSVAVGQEAGATFEVGTYTNRGTSSIDAAEGTTCYFGSLVLEDGTMTMTGKGKYVLGNAPNDESEAPSTTFTVFGESAETASTTTIDITELNEQIFDIQESTTFTLSFAEDMLATSALHEPQEMKLLLIEGYEGFTLDDEFLVNLLAKTTYETLTSGDTAALTLLGAGIDMQTSENGGFYVQNAAYLVEDNNLYWTGTVTTVPEPTTATLSLLALAALAARRRRK